MKRGRKSSGGSDTGGTGDIKPQFMTMAGAVAGAVDDYRVDVFQIPVVRPRGKNESATIMEMLSLDWYLSVENIGDAAFTEAAFLTQNTARTSGDTATVGSFAADVGDPRTLGMVILNQTLTTSGSMSQVYPIHVDLTDSNGNGILWGNDTITMVSGAVANATAGATICKLKYRWVNVGLVEFLGIVQSQSA